MKYTILIAEDNSDIVKILKLYLENYRFDNGISAFAMIQVVTKCDFDSLIYERW